ncbi:hypothetical protein KIN20_009408 [Parelaphostrongylus tenuis]|uniref:Uncharacterized protein n=1 Tax=Parelaphostrongylus tenuis TaxID=148309 RepID=A0AAD5MRS6_PARTN|nr:hypothetical protein KIN20_009408 [Parelaphostrongylus tenuis]
MEQFAGHRLNAFLIEKNEFTMGALAGWNGQGLSPLKALPSLPNKIKMLIFWPHK